MYQFNMGMVKYYNEKVDLYEVLVRFSIVNLKLKIIYVQVEIIDVGNLNFIFVDGIIVKQYLINVNIIFVVFENLLLGINLFGIVKDLVIFKVSYYLNLNYIGLFGIDII